MDIRFGLVITLKKWQDIVEQSPDYFGGFGKLWIDVTMHFLRRL